MGFQLFNYLFHCIEGDVLKLCGITYEILRQIANGSGISCMIN